MPDFLVQDQAEKRGSYPTPYITKEDRGRKRFRYRGLYTPDEEEEYALRTIQERWVPEHHYKATLERTWQYNIAFLLGYQWHTWNERQFGLVTRPRSRRWRVRETRNFIRPFFERAIASLTGFSPKFRVAPNSTDIEDEQAARVGEQLLEHYYQKMEMPDLIEDLAAWMLTCGTAFLKVYWDPQEGNRFLAPAVDEHGNWRTDEFGNPVEDQYFEGDLAVKVRSAFQMHVDPLANKHEEVTWMLEAGMRPLSWVDQHFPEMAPYVESDSKSEDRERSQRSILNVLGPRSGGWGQYAGEYTANDWVTVKEYWEKPTAVSPRGRLIIEANNVILRTGDNPMPGHCLPYIPFHAQRVPGRYWSQSPIENLITPQRNYNKLVSKRLEHNFVMGMSAKILFPSLAGIPQSSWISDVGEVVKYDGQTAPSYLTPPSLPPESDTEMHRVKADFDDMTATYGAERGQFQGKLSGVAIQLLVEQGMKSKEPQVRREAFGLRKWGEIVLKVIQENVTEERAAKIVGKASQYEIVSFTGADLHDNTDVRVEISSMLPKSRTLALQEITQLTQAGMLNPMDPEDKQTAWKMLDMETSDTAIYDKTLHRRAAQQENKLMLMGQPVEEPQWFEDHDEHMAQHRASMASAEYKEAPPAVKALFMLHTQQHGVLANPPPGVTLPPEMQAQVSQAMPQGGAAVDTTQGAQ